jgi:PII-like signaling protein
MFAGQPAFKVTIHLNRDTDTERGFLRDELLRFLQSSGIAGATVLHATAGFGAHHRLHQEGAGAVAGEHLPVVLSFIDTEERVIAILPGLLEMVSDGMVEAHPTHILKRAVSESKVIA